MANNNPIKIVQFNTIQQFFDALQGRPHVRLVKVADEGFLQPARRRSGIVMQSMVKVVATAADHKTNQILRWDDIWDVESNVISLNASGGPGRHNDPTAARTRDKIILECRKRSLKVVRDAEWAPEDLNDTWIGIGPRPK